MMNGLYKATAAMVVAKARQELVASNVANVDTAGFRKQVLSEEVFSQSLMMTQVGGKSTGLGDTDAKTALRAPVTDFSQGSVVSTDSPYHMAITGEGFFTVSTAAGDRYTRSGDFRLDGEGFVVDGYGGYLALGDGQRINVPADASFAVAEDGTVTVEGNVVGRLNIVTFARMDGLLRDNNGQFIDAGAASLPSGATLLQRHLERSNVDLGQEMIEMIMVNRIFEGAQRIVQTYDELMSKAKEIGSVR
jgi:flagellar basal body rod protein FlgG